MSQIPNTQTVDIRKDTRLSRSQRRQVEDYCETGEKQLNQGKKLQALEYFQAALEIDNACVEAWSGLVAVYRALGKVNKAEEAQKQVALLLRGSVDLKKIGRDKKRLLKKYRSKARHGIVKKGHDTLGIGVFGFSDKAVAKMAKIEDDIKALNGYSTEGVIGRQVFEDIRKSCLDKRVKRSRKNVLSRKKISYRWMMFKSVVKAMVLSKFGVSMSGIAPEGEKQLRDKIAALDPKKGRDWCDRAKRRIKKLPKVLKAVGFVLGVGLGLLLVFYVIKYFLYVIVGGVFLMILIGLLKD